MTWLLLSAFSQVYIKNREQKLDRRLKKSVVWGKKYCNEDMVS